MTSRCSDEIWRTTGWRWCKFSLVGAMGIVVQLGTLALLTTAGVEYLLATAVAVEAAVLHNFAWHQNFTWNDRRGGILGRLARFHLTNGAISILGNIVLMRLLVGYCGLPALPANLGSIAVCWLANFLAADRVVFLRRSTPESGGARCSVVPDGTLLAVGPRPPLKWRATFVASLWDVFFLPTNVEYNVEQVRQYGNNPDCSRPKAFAGCRSSRAADKAESVRLGTRRPAGAPAEVGNPRARGTRPAGLFQAAPSKR
jgi:putative flippase GtrA